MTAKKYGYYGWKEFEIGRNEILREYDRSKEANQSRPVQTEHGNAGEAAIRRWLENLLPAKFGVTSGYIIPDVIVTDNYKLYHYDVIIFDKMNAPILWEDGNYDQSNQGKKRAIPSKYVRAVIEVKAKFTQESVTAAIKKLSELNLIAQHLPPNFTCSIAFVEIDKTLPKTEILRDLLPDPAIFGYSGGIILRTALNSEMTGRLSLLKAEKGEKHEDILIPLAKDIDELNIYLDDKGNPTIGGQGEGLVCFSDGKDWHFSKTYGPQVFKNETGISLSWSYNNFANYTLDTLAYLEGRSPKANDRYFFGQVFDVITPKK
jgi:hypothetical protein